MGEIFCCCGCCLKLLSLLNVKKLKTDQIIHLSMTKERAAIALMLIVTSLMLNAREVIDLNRDWRFHRGDSKMWQAPDADDGDWEVINVPHNITSEADDDGKFGAVGIAEADGLCRYNIV